MKSCNRNDPDPKFSPPLRDRREAVLLRNNSVSIQYTCVCRFCCVYMCVYFCICSLVESMMKDQHPQLTLVTNISPSLFLNPYHVIFIILVKLNTRSIRNVQGERKREEIFPTIYIFRDNT